MPKKFLFTFVIFICAINIAYANDDAIFVTERNGINYYVLGDVIHKSPVKPDDLFELDIGETNTSGYNQTMYFLHGEIKKMPTKNGMLSLNITATLTERFTGRFTKIFLISAVTNIIERF